MTFNAQSQIQNKHLDEEKSFKLKPDLHLNLGDRSIIADTKYKIVYSDNTDPKKGISQNDLYQMLAYAIRFDVNEIILYYPNTIKIETPSNSKLFIVDEIAGGDKVCVKSFQLPIINKNLFDTDYQAKSILSEDFSDTKIELINSIKKSLDFN